MEELTDALGASFQVSRTANNIYAAHPRQNEYKKKTAYSSDQDTRRKRYLEIQKQKRIDYKLHARKLAMDEWSDHSEEEDLETQAGDDEMEIEALTHVKPPRRYKDQLMLSEWLVEKPSDFEENWLMVLCPTGRRNLVVAARGRTSNYSKSGYRISTFSSNLPGGHKTSAAGYTLLDCIYCEVTRTFYILDLMCWNQHPFYDCETEFRFFWLQSKMAEIHNEVETPYSFKIPPRCKCNNDEMKQVLGSHLSNSTDGVLFYHKSSFYTFGTTPLVLWLKPHMLPDMLGVDIPSIEDSEPTPIDES